MLESSGYTKYWSLFEEEVDLNSFKESENKVRMDYSDFLSHRFEFEEDSKKYKRRGKYFIALQIFILFLNVLYGALNDLFHVTIDVVEYVVATFPDFILLGLFGFPMVFAIYYLVFPGIKKSNIEFLVERMMKVKIAENNRWIYRGDYLSKNYFGVENISFSGLEKYFDFGDSYRENSTKLDEEFCGFFEEGGPFFLAKFHYFLRANSQKNSDVYRHNFLLSFPGVELENLFVRVVDNEVKYFEGDVENIKSKLLDFFELFGDFELRIVNKVAIFRFLNMKTLVVKVKSENSESVKKFGDISGLYETEENIKIILRYSKEVCS